jgi:hypothetical protein
LLDLIGSRSDAGCARLGEEDGRGGLTWGGRRHRRWARLDPIGDEGPCVAAGREGEGERVRVCGDDWTVCGDVMAAWVGSSADGGGLGFGQTMLVRRIGNIWTVKMLSRGDPWKGIPKL